MVHDAAPPYSRTVLIKDGACKSFFYVHFFETVVQLWNGIRRTKSRGKPHTSKNVVKKQRTSTKKKINTATNPSSNKQHVNQIKFHHIANRCTLRLIDQFSAFRGAGFAFSYVLMSGIYRKSNDQYVSRVRALSLDVTLP